MADLDLDLTMASSAVEAISVLEERKVDIVLMDICMPQMSGLELYDVIRQRWPRSKMIFLTGHLEFDYVYKVHKHARYVLKAEEDEKIVEAVKESIDEIENDLMLERMTLNHSRHQHRNKYYERLLLLRELVEGSISSSQVSQAMFDQMGSDLDISEQMYCVMIRCPAMRYMSHKDQEDFGEKMSALIEKIFLENWRGTYFGYNRVFPQSMCVLHHVPECTFPGGANGTNRSGSAGSFPVCKVCKTCVSGKRRSFCVINRSSGGDRGTDPSKAS